MKTLVFTATDTLFFRESRPMEAQGELQSVFPPPVKTLAGAVRTLIGEQMQVNWSLFKDKSDDEICKKLRPLIGFGEADLGQLSFAGAWLMHQGERLYPAPLHLMKTEKALTSLTLDKNLVYCDLGKRVRLAALDDKYRGATPLENTWLSQQSMQQTLNGELPKLSDLKEESSLLERESRLGIARDYQTHAVREGLLYQTRHVRPQRDVVIALEVAGLPDDFPKQSMLRLGGEGRSACVELLEKTTPALSLPQGIGRKFALYLLTPLHRGNTPSNQPLPDFTVVDRNTEQTYWQGKINGVALKLHGAITGKMQREGGWDLASHQPREVINLTPAGSVFFCELDDQEIALNDALAALHLKQYGSMTKYGYGQFAVGIWKD